MVIAPQPLPACSISHALVLQVWVCSIEETTQRIR